MWPWLATPPAPLLMTSELVSVSVPLSITPVLIASATVELVSVTDSPSAIWIAPLLASAVRPMP